MANKVPAQPNEKLLSELQRYKEQNQILSDTIILLKQQYREEHNERLKYASLYEKAEVQIQMLKKSLQQVQSHKHNQSILSTPKLPPVKPTEAAKTPSEYHSIVTGSTKMKTNLQKRNSMNSNIDQISENDKDNSVSIGRFQTMKNIKAHSRENSETGSKKEGFMKKSSMNVQMPEERRSIERRRSYFQKMSEK